MHTGRDSDAEAGGAGGAGGGSGLVVEEAGSAGEHDKGRGKGVFSPTLAALMSPLAHFTGLSRSLSPC